MKVYIDSDVILDYLYEREPFSSNSKIIIALIEKKIVKGYISSLILWNIYYVLSKYLGEREARKKIKIFRSLIEIIAVDGKIIDLGLSSNIKDFEDSIQYYAADSANVDFLITRNKKDYPKSGLRILNPDEFIKIMQEKLSDSLSP